MASTWIAWCRSLMIAFGGTTPHVILRVCLCVWVCELVCVEDRQECVWVYGCDLPFP